MATQPSPRTVEAFIKSLQTALAPLPTRWVQKQGVLHLMVEFPQEALMDRPQVLQRVASQLGRLPVEGVSQVVVYGRLRGETQPRWKTVFDLAADKRAAKASQTGFPTHPSTLPPAHTPENPDFRRLKTLVAPVSPTPPPRLLSSQPPLPPARPTPELSPRPLEGLLGQLLETPQLRPVLAGILALLLLVGGGLVVRSFRAADAPSRAVSLALGIPLLVLAAGGAWRGWKAFSSAGAETSSATTGPFAEGLAFLQAQRIPEAIVQFRRAVQRQPGHALAHFELAKCLVKTNRLQEGLKHFQQAKRLNPKLKDIDLHLVEAMKAQARQWLAQHQPDEVLTHLPEVLPLTKGAAQAEIHSLLGQARAEKGEWAEALAQQQTAVALDPHSSEAHLRLAEIRMALGQWEEAIDSCWAALELNDRLGEAHHIRGQALLRKGQLQAAIGAFRTALQLDLSPSRATQVRVDLALALIHAGHWIQASQELNQVLLADSQQGRAYYGLGLVLAAQGQYSQALQNYQRALELDPTLSEARAAIGLAYLGQKQQDASGRRTVPLQQVLAAMECFEQALQQNPNLPEAHFGMGEVWRLKGALTAAEVSYQKALHFNGSYSLAHYRLGLVFARKGQVQEAIQELRLALELRPNFPEAKRNLERLLSQQPAEATTDLAAV